MNDDDFEWDIGNEMAGIDITAQVLKYNAPISKHTCDPVACSGKVLQSYHAIEDVFDDFELSLRQREVMRMEVIQSRGRENKERALLRMFQSTVTGEFIIKMQTATLMTTEPMGQIEFDKQSEVHDYYNYCIKLFGFSKTHLVGQPEEDELDWDTDEDDDFDWDTEEADDEIDWEAEDEEEPDWE